MVFTLFHLGPALLAAMLLYRYLDFPTVLVASLVVDIRAAAVYLGLIDGSYHGFLHTYAGGTLLAFILIGAITVFRPGLENAMNRYLNISQSPTDGSMVGAAFIGIYLHITVDSVLAAEMNPFLPVTGNPMHGLTTIREVYLFCVGSMLAGLLIYWAYSSELYQKLSTVSRRYV